MKLPLVIWWALAGGVLFATAPASAQTAPSKVPAPDGGNGPTRPWLRELWVPADALAPILGRYPRAVALNHEQLITLLNDAHADDPASPDAANVPPVRAVLRQARFEGWPALGPDAQPQVRVEAELEVEALTDAWADVPLGLPGIVLGTAEVADPAPVASVGAPPLLARPGSGGASLRRPGPGPESPASLLLQGRGVHRLHLGFVLPVTSGPDGRSIALPQVEGVGDFLLHLPAGSRADSTRGCAIQPEEGKGMIARVALGHGASGLPKSADSIRSFMDRAQLATPGNAPAVLDRLSWRTVPPAPDGTGALLQSGRMEAAIEESGVTVRQEIVLRPVLGRLPVEARVALPAGSSAVRVEGAGLAQWDLGADGLRIALTQNAGGNNEMAAFTVVYGLPLALDANGNTARLGLPLLEVAGAHRVTGELLVRRGPGVVVRRIDPGLVATPTAGDLSPRAEGLAGEFVAGFKLADLPNAANVVPPVALTLEARRATARFSVDADARAEFQPDGVRIRRSLSFHVEEGELFTARVKLPPGETLLTLNADKGSLLPDWRQEGSDLLLNWSTGLADSSKTVLMLDCRADLPAPRPGVPGNFVFGAATVAGAERLTGYIALGSAPAFRLATTGGEERLERRDGRTTPMRGDVAWFYRDGFQLAVRVERRAAETEARFTGYALPLAGAVEIHAQINYHFLYSGVESVKIRVPRESADAFFFTGENIAERRLDDGVWTIRFQGEKGGDYALGVQATIPAPADKTDAQRFHFRLPVIAPLETARWSGVWAVEANTDTEIRFTTTGVNEVDALHAPTLAGYQARRRVIGVFEFLGGAADAAIDLDGVRHPAAAVAAAVVDRLELETSASTSGVLRHRATVRARTAGDGFFDLRLPDGATLWSLTLDGGLIKPVGGAGAPGTVRVELPGGREPADASTVVVVYETPGSQWKSSGWRSVVAPRFDDKVPVLQSHWTLRLPDGFDYQLPRPLVTEGLPDASLDELLLPRIVSSLGRMAGPIFHSGDLRIQRMAIEHTAADPEVREMVTPMNAPPPAMATLPQEPFQQNEDSTAAMNRKLQRIIIPHIEFRSTTIQDAVEFLRQESVRHDPDPDSEARGINIFLRLTSSANEHPSSSGTRITMTLDRIPLLEALRYLATQAGLKIVVEPYAVTLAPLTEVTDVLITREFYIEPHQFGSASNGGVLNEAAILAGGSGSNDRKVTGAGSATISRQSSENFLKSSGVQFPPGASVTYLPSTNKLVVRNTQENIDLVEALVSTGGSASPIDQIVLHNGREAAKGVVGLLPLQLDLPQNGRAYEFARGGAPGTLDFHYVDRAAAARWQWVCVTIGALGFLFLAASWAHPWRRTFYAVLLLTFLPLIVAPSIIVTCNALLAGWLWAVAGWVITRLLLRRRRLVPVLLACMAAIAPLQASAAPSPTPAPTSDAPSELVIVPYDATRPAATQEPTQYYLPYERFLLLWDAAKRHRRPPAPEPPPGADRYTLSAARYDARLSGDTLAIDGVLDLQTSGNDWVGVPLRFDQNRLGAVTLDNIPAALGADGVLWVGTPGKHRVGVTLRLPAGTVTANTRLSWRVPPATAALVTLLLPRADLRAEVSGGVPGGGAVEETTPEGRRLIASVGGAQSVDILFHDAPTPAPSAAQPALARVDTRLTATARQEAVRAEIRLSFPGNTQDHFLLHLDRSLTLTGLDAPDIRQWRLTSGGDRQTLEITLDSPARDAYQVVVSADRPIEGLPSTRRIFPVVSAQATRQEQTAALLIAGEVELSLPDGPPAGSRWVNYPSPEQEKLVAAFAGDGTAAAVYSVRAVAGKRTAHIDYLYQVGRGKIELAASVRLVPASGGEPLLSADLRLPTGFTVQAVAGDTVGQWWREGDVLSVRFRPGSGRDEVPLLVYLVRQFDRAPEQFALQPLVAAGFSETDGQTVVAADRSVKVGLTLPAGTRAQDLSEIPANTAAADFQVKAPLERQRAFRYRGPEFNVAATLENLPARWRAQWVTQATVREGSVALETHVNAETLQGAVDALEFSLPPGVAEARVSGPDVRETVVTGGGQNRRTYRVLLQNPLYADAETGFMISLELLLGADGRAALPDLLLPSENGRAAGGYLLVENASSGEMALDAHGLDPAIEKDVPFLPALIVAGTRFYRAAPGVPWTLGLRVTNLEKTAGREALVAYAELTTTLRADGEEWHRATYRLQNRRLQFLPVELPEGMEFIGARVAGDSVRVDAGQGGKKTLPQLLVPLLKTRPGELSYDVELIYRRPTSGPAGGGRGPSVAHWQMRDPRLPGVPVEKTLWNVYLPEDTRLLNIGGNLEPVVAALTVTEKLESNLSDLRNLSATYQSASASQEERQRALGNYNQLAAQVAKDASVNKDWSEAEGSDKNALFRKPNVSLQNAEVNRKQQVILGTVNSLNGSNKLFVQGQIQQQAPALANGTATTQQAPNGNGFDGFVQYGSPITSSGSILGDVPLVGRLWRDNRALAAKVQSSQARGEIQLGRDVSPAPGQEQLALNDSVTVNLATVVAKSAKREDAKSKESGDKQIPKRLSTARATATDDMPSALPAPAMTPSPKVAQGPAVPGAAGGSASALEPLTVPQPRAPGLPSLDNPAAPGNADGIVGAVAGKVRSKNLHSEGRISLAVEFPQEGRVYHFKKIKDDAHLTLWSVEPSRFARLGWLCVLLAGVVATLGGRRLICWRNTRRNAMFATS